VPPSSCIWPQDWLSVHGRPPPCQAPLTLASVIFPADPKGQVITPQERQLAADMQALVATRAAPLQAAKSANDLPSNTAAIASRTCSMVRLAQAIGAKGPSSTRSTSPTKIPVAGSAKANRPPAPCAPEPCPPPAIRPASHPETAWKCGACRQSRGFAASPWGQARTDRPRFSARVWRSWSAWTGAFPVWSPQQNHCLI